MLIREDGIFLRLLHPQPGLSIDLTEMADLGVAEEYCERLAEFLDLPSLTFAGRAESDDETVDAPPAPRRNRAIRQRRPRFLARRQTAKIVDFPRLGGREITARN